MSKQQSPTDPDAERAAEITRQFKEQLKDLGFSVAGVVNISRPGDTTVQMLSFLTVNPAQTLTAPFSAIALVATEPHPESHRQMAAFIRLHSNVTDLADHN